MTKPEETSDREIRQLAETPRPGIVREFLGFLKENRNWWLVPILIILALLGFLVTLGSSVVAPFIYPLF
jgi:Family of unknown function (DUF5989)